MRGSLPAESCIRPEQEETQTTDNLEQHKICPNTELVSSLYNTAGHLYFPQIIYLAYLDEKIHKGIQTEFKQMGLEKVGIVVSMGKVG